MATDLIRYDLLVQEALRGVVRTVLTDAARNGLQGDHHFFITFRTNAPGLRLSDRMREQYKEEMTIILQHQFWDLSVGDQAFEVGLSFGGKPERLIVPFAAITTFHDPSVQFGLKFDVADEVAHDDAPPAETATPASGKRALAAVDSGAAVPAQSAVAALPTPAKPREVPAPGQGNAVAEKDKTEDGDVRKVVSIDAFRKKP